MSDILFVYPKAGHDLRGVSVSAPLALLSLAAVLRESFTVTILDQRACDDFEGSLIKELSTQPLFAGVTSMTGTQIFHALAVTESIKRISPETPVLWGGMHPTIYPEQTLAKDCIDFVIKGEGEPAIKRFAEVMSAGRQDFEKVPGLYWKKNGRILSTPLADPYELDDSPKIPWDLVSVEEYISPTQFLYPGIQRLLPFQGSRGCPFKCTFCSEPVLTRKYRMMSPEKMVEECWEMTQRFKLDHICFFDEEFFVHRKWATRVAEIIGGQFSWCAQTRSADLLHVDLKKMEKCGLMVVAPGLESGSDRVLKFIKKNETVKEYLEANLRLAETGIFAQYNFIIGYPSETAGELNQTIDLILRLLKENKHALVNQLSPLTPLPGTELLRQVVRDYGFQEPSHLEGWIQITRGKQEKPWLDADALRRVRFLYYTSYFLCSAERYSQKFKIPKWVFRLYSLTVRWRWQQKWFHIDWEVPLLRLLFKWFVNPVDYATEKKFEEPAPVSTLSSPLPLVTALQS